MRRRLLLGLQLFLLQPLPVGHTPSQTGTGLRPVSHRTGYDYLSTSKLRDLAPVLKLTVTVLAYNP